MQNEKKPGEGNAATAQNRGVAVGGNVTGSTIITGDGNTSTQTTFTRQGFLTHLQELESHLQEASLAPDLAQELQADVASVRRQAEKDEPNRSLVLGKLQTILDVLKSAADTGTRLVPLAQRLGEMASVLF